ncbi:hypothetical protein EYF80_038156 [Liparis tanakae]|uniref:Uncharacterized protein n=1 Tax=Liparis tanakae TaxID=230148 RepID=A0A4Z2GED8_9TELE|nr:hypothetical protein EYF80_038156 [Liparis tanakae]
MRDSNLHFNYVAQVIRCYLAPVIGCALRQPGTTVKQPRESHSLSVPVCVGTGSGGIKAPVLSREPGGWEKPANGKLNRPGDTRDYVSSVVRGDRGPVGPGMHQRSEPSSAPRVEGLSASDEASPTPGRKAASPRKSDCPWDGIHSTPGTTT